MTKYNTRDLFDAIRSSNATLTNLILSTNSSLINERDANGNNPFHVAFQIGNPSVISELINSAAPQNITSLLKQRNHDFSYPVEFLSDQDESNLNQIITTFNNTSDDAKKEALLSAKNHVGQTLPHLLVQGEKFSTVGGITEVYTNELNTGDLAGNTPVHDMVIWEQDEALSRTLSSSSINDTYGVTLLSKGNNEYKSPFVLSYEFKNSNTTGMIVNYTNATGLAHLFNQKLGTTKNAPTAVEAFFRLEAAAYDFIKGTLSNIVTRFNELDLYTFLSATGIIRNVMANKLYNLTDFSEGVYNKIGAQQMHLLMSAGGGGINGYQLINYNSNQTNFNSEIMYGIKTYILNLTNPFDVTTNVSGAILSWNATQVNAAKDAIAKAIVPYNITDNRFSGYFAIEEALESRLSAITAEGAALRSDQGRALVLVDGAKKHFDYISGVVIFVDSIKGNYSLSNNHSLVSYCSQEVDKQIPVKTNSCKQKVCNNAFKISESDSSQLKIFYDTRQAISKEITCVTTECSTASLVVDLMPGPNSLKIAAFCNLKSETTLSHNKEYGNCLFDEGMAVFNRSGDASKDKCVSMVENQCNHFNDSAVPQLTLEQYCHVNGSVIVDSVDNLCNFIVGHTHSSNLAC